MLGSRQEIIKIIKSHGGIWTSTVTGNTEILVIHPNELSPPTAKVRKAKSFGIPIVNEQWLIDSLKSKKVFCFVFFFKKMFSILFIFYFLYLTHPNISILVYQC